MAYTTIQGYAPSTTEPIDSRQLVATQAARFAIAAFNAYNGLIVFQQSDSTIWVLIDITNIANGGGWSQVGGSGGWVPFTGQTALSDASTIFSVDPANYRAIYVNYYLEYDDDQFQYPSRTGQIQVTIPIEYTTEQMYYTEQTTETIPTKHDKAEFSINTQQAVISFSYDGSTSLIKAVLTNTNADFAVYIRGEYKTIAKI
jgi:hypothetical protein